MKMNFKDVPNDKHYHAIYRLFELIRKSEEGAMFQRHSVYCFLLLVTVTASFLSVGCAKPPTEEMIKAEKALQEAKEKEAHIYAPVIYEKTDESFRKALELVAARKYEQAGIIAKETINLAQQAISLSEFNKEKMKEEAEQMILDIHAVIDELRSLPAEAFKKKAFVTHEQLQDMITNREIDLTHIKDKLKAEQIQQAYEELEIMKEQVHTQREDVTASLKAKQE